ncbi:MAG: NUDIX hydrolase [Candidatus Nezhaarchaeota archaeon]|nr:NUDIX hydrolase [Candidatus Nezhaarchaeota archaeon]MCX8141414.1 NUDIX hydrolase [Candidatus Nezhaarchaeota archaeon]MDW8049680.1 NUDIX hydrolase [Nitrososphaerota archaeon]
MSKLRPILAVDALVVRRGGSIVLVKRKRPPYEGFWALPGGFVEYGEAVEEAVKREVKEETGLDVEIRGLIGVYSKPDRDPRGHVISIAYLTTEVGGQLRGSEETEVSEFYTIPDKMAFDHNSIIQDGLRLAKKMGISVFIHPN